MNRKIVALAMLTLASIFVFAEEYNLIEHYQIGPGTYYSYYEEYTKPWCIHVTEIDLTNPYLTIETVKAQDKLYAQEVASSMSKRNDKEGHRVVMGTNGDFYNTSTGEPSNNQVANGEFVKGYSTGANAFTYSEGGIPGICAVYFSGSVISKNASGNEVAYPLTAVNRSRSTDNLLIYNNFYGSNTGTSAGGFECLARAISDWVVNDTVFAVIEEKDSIANRTIPAGKFVISGQGGAADFISQNFTVGDTVKIIQEIANSPKKLTQLIGGGVWFLKNGIDQISPTDVTRHPRTGVGFSADSTKLYFMVVDGRADHSIGMDYHQMGDFLLFMGASHALNLDGGGSSTMIVRNSIMNKPSDGSERSNANGILCVSSASNGTFTHLQIPRDSIAVYKNKSAYIGLSGWDENYNPATVDWNSLNISYDNTLGSYESNVFTAFEKNGNTYVKAEYNGEADSIIVHIIELTNLSAYPDTLTLDSVNSIKYAVTASTESGGSRVFDNSLFNFMVLDPSIAEIDDEGVIIGKENGETDVIISYGDERDTAHVYIQIGAGEVVVDEVETLNGWTISSDTYINDTETSIALVDRIAGSGSKALQVNYSRTGDEDGNIYLEVDPIDLYGVPSDILVDVLSDSIKHWIYILLEDNRGVEYSVKSSSSLRYNDDYRTQYLDLKNLLPADGDQLYPLKFKGVRLRIDDKATTGSLYFDRIRIIYPTWTAIEDYHENIIPQDYKLLQNYPNPFNPTTTLSYELSSDSHVDLSIFDLKGNKITTLINDNRSAGSYSIRFNAADLPGGVYFYRLQADNWADTKKMLLIK